MDEILWCYHSNETSLEQRLQGAIYFLGFYEKDIWNFCEFFLLVVRMNERVDILAELLFMESVYCMSRYT